MDAVDEGLENSARTWTAEEAAFLDALRAGQTMESSAGILSLSYSGVFARRKRDPAFDAAVKDASTEGRKLQAAKIAKALYEGAEKMGQDPRFTTAAIFALKNLDPEHWRDQHDISGPGGASIPIQIVTFGGGVDAEVEADAVDAEIAQDEGDGAGGQPRMLPPGPECAQ